MKTDLRRTVLATRVVLVLLSALLCGGAALARVSVVATTPDYGALAERIGGGHVKVTVLAKATEDPHFVDAKPSHLVTLNRADVLIESGADLEMGWLPPLVDGARNKKILPGAPGRILGSTGLDLLDVPAELDRSKGDIHAKGNPHFLMDPSNAVRFAQRLADVFCGIEARSCDDFRSNLSDFQREVERKTAEWERKLAPFAGAPIVTYHNTWRYFARRFRLDAAQFLEPKPGIPPSPPHLARVIGTMRSEKIAVILVEPFQSRRTAEAVADRTGARVVPVCQFPGGLPGTDGSYIALMDANVDAIAAALAATR